MARFASPRAAPSLGRLEFTKRPSIKPLPGYEPCRGLKLQLDSRIAYRRRLRLRLGLGVRFRLRLRLCFCLRLCLCLCLTGAGWELAVGALAANGGTIRTHLGVLGTGDGVLDRGLGVSLGSAGAQRKAQTQARSGKGKPRRI